MFRLTISKKISLSVILVLSVSIAAMAWLTGRSLQSGFNDYLKERQIIELASVAAAMSAYFQNKGDFADLRHNPEAVRVLIDQALGREPRVDSRLPSADRAANRPAAGEGAVDERMLRRGPLGRPIRRDRPDHPDHPDRQERFDRSDRPPPRERAIDDDSSELDMRMPRPEQPEMGPRFSMVDAAGEPVFGPLRLAQNSLKADISVSGVKVGTMLAPIPQFSLEKTTFDFIRGQLKHIFWLAFALIFAATVVSIWLGKHLIRPIAGLKKVTQQIANGQFDARAEILNQDEIGGLAEHINAMAKNLEFSESKRRKIMADLSHELRTPLTVMRAEVEAVLDGVRPLNQQSIQSLESEIAHLNKLVDDLHQLALADAGDLRFQFTSIDINALIAQIAERFQARMQKHGLELQLDLAHESVMLNADASRMTQIIENLLENCLRYTDQHGRVLIRTTREMGLARVWIEDSAPGLADGQHEKMFERLYREDKARSRAKGGSGLGLSICRTLVKAHRGEISASASMLGGVKISMVFPLDDNRTDR